MKLLVFLIWSYPHNSVFCVFLDSVFVNLAPVNYRSTLMAKIVYIPTVIQSLVSAAPSLFSLTHQVGYFPVLNQLRLGSRQLGRQTLYPQARWNYSN